MAGRLCSQDVDIEKFPMNPNLIAKEQEEKIEKDDADASQLAKHVVIFTTFYIPRESFFQLR